ncbi:uncharacterized protein AMSG_10338 [Thecamonas trahens ATCC 50062]|uniref:Centrosomal protein of 44 kDa n=1 Tax=Thecamonas trahens ATCC 50062 TaxID=461836 RepID=A0A0L0DQ00_THETB|nr:hypothetical protein AMSG_10338 [Thecamonas trahens ATCC 50062]KNC54345.1 hypothetical protein AMSG_10338 [Thecamonas trahens ATCC 50062]|eukprot:XP_013753801.1 hypothetical protein AMSG_10338 [Thecamonas trahens ATCC 50062]
MTTHELEATGDVENHVRVIHRQLHRLGIPIPLSSTGGGGSGSGSSGGGGGGGGGGGSGGGDDGGGLASGSPAVVLPILGHLGRSLLGIRPRLSAAQFFAPGFVEHKLLFLRAILDAIVQMDADLARDAGELPLTKLRQPRRRRIVAAPELARSADPHPDAIAYPPLPAAEVVAHATRHEATTGHGSEVAARAAFASVELQVAGDEPVAPRQAPPPTPVTPPRLQEVPPSPPPEAGTADPDAADAGTDRYSVQRLLATLVGHVDSLSDRFGQLEQRVDSALDNVLARVSMVEGRVARLEEVRAIEGEASPRRAPAPSPAPALATTAPLPAQSEPPRSGAMLAALQARYEERQRVLNACKTSLSPRK